MMNQPNRTIHFPCQQPQADGGVCGRESAHHTVDMNHLENSRCTEHHGRLRIPPRYQPEE